VRRGSAPFSSMGISKVVVVVVVVEVDFENTLWRANTTYISKFKKLK